MAMCSKWKYKNITPKVFQVLQKTGKRQGMSIPSTPMGRFTINAMSMNIGFQYSWNSTSGILILECVSKPMLIGCSTIKGMADKIIKESGGNIG